MKLYQELLALTKETDSFYFKDEELLGARYRIFNYRYCTYEDWLRPSALESRGIMFEMKGEEPIRIASRPMEKFFNLNENPLTSNLDASKISRVMEKVDGSLISTFSIEKLLFFKTKGTIFSDQALFARNLAHEMGHRFYCDCMRAEANGYTVNMEYVAPNNRVVLPYREEKLFVLNLRRRDTGEYMPVKMVKSEYPGLWSHFVFGRCADNMSDNESRVMLSDKAIKKLEGIEGYIWVMEGGQMVKVKTDWYVAKHKAKDNASNFNYVFDAVLAQASDDIRTALADDPTALELLNKVENIVVPLINRAQSLVESFAQSNKGLSRKEYAAKASLEVPDVFSMVMSAYDGKEADFAAWAHKRRDRFKVLCNVNLEGETKNESKM